MLGILRLVIHEYPEEHPYETEKTDYDKGHLPSEQVGKHRYNKRCRKGSDRTAGIEDCSSKSPVLLRKVFRCRLDGSREIAALTKSKYCTADQKEPYADGSDSRSCCGTCLEGLESLNRGYPLYLHGKPSATCVEASSSRPYSDSPEKALLGSHPVNETAGEKTAEGIEQGEETCYSSVIGICPMQFRCYIILPCKRKDLLVEIVDCRRTEKEDADPPSPVCHLFFHVIGRML